MNFLKDNGPNWKNEDKLPNKSFSYKKNYYIDYYQDKTLILIEEQYKNT